MSEPSNLPPGCTDRDIERAAGKECPTCEGSGEVSMDCVSEGRTISEPIKCMECCGTGSVEG